ncbi:unnamed protein product, partial [marine sediment metagenome]
MQEKGYCKHGEFILSEGCPQCIAERREQSTGHAPTSIGSTTGGLADDPLLLPGEPIETALALRPGEDVEAHGYFEEASRLLEYAE